MPTNLLTKLINRYKSRKNKKVEFNSKNEKEAYNIIGKLYPQYRDKSGKVTKLQPFDKKQKKFDYMRVFRQVKETRENKNYKVRKPYANEK